MIKKITLSALMLFAIVFTSCSDSDIKITAKASLTLKTSKLPSLGSDYVYEGWIIVNGKPVSTGTFSSSTNSTTVLNIDAAKLKAATKFVLSIEPKNETGDAKATPSKVKILSGDFSGKTATLSVAPIGDFSAAAGTYLLNTPTDGNGTATTNPKSGIWFMKNKTTAGLTLPTLKDGWKYEGWVVMSTPVSTGTFKNVSGADDAKTFSGTSAGPAFPGEDFLKAAPTGLTFPVDLSGKKVVISIEPDPDNSTAPFFLKPLTATIPTDAIFATPYNMAKDLSDFPKGTAER